MGETRGRMTASAISVPVHNGLFWFKKGHFRGFSKVGILDIGGTHWKALVFRFVKSPILGP